MQYKLLSIVATALIFSPFNAAHAASKNLQVEFINDTDVTAQAVAAPTIGDINGGGSVNINAHETTAAYTINTYGFKHGVVEATWQVNKQQVVCPTALLPKRFSGQQYEFVLSNSGAENYTCTEIEKGKDK